MKEYILALDQGTSSSRAFVYNEAGGIASSAREEFRQIYPQPGWVEHDPNDIWDSQLRVAQQALKTGRIAPRNIVAVGIANQRETTIIWERNSGMPLHNAIVWQDRRTADICERLKKDGLSDYIRQKTGLVIDAYFSGSKIAWLLDTIPDARARAKRGEILFGTVDSWLMWKLSDGLIHATDYTNASRTMLYDINTLQWDMTLLKALDIPIEMMPTVNPSGFIFGETAPDLFGGVSIPIGSAAGDQHSALFGQGCFSHGLAKNTYGTGSFLLMNIGYKPRPSSHGLLTTIAWGIGNDVFYALEGAIFSTGSAVQWLRDDLNLIDSAEESEERALRTPDTAGVYMVPAFTGLGAPYWDMYARGAIVGLTRGSGRDHVVRAVLESLAYQTRDVLEAMRVDSGVDPRELRADGGAAANDFLMQFQADILGITVVRPSILEATSRGAAYLAGIAMGYWKNKQSLEESIEIERRFDPHEDRERFQRLYAGWKRAVDRARDWEPH